MTSALKRNQGLNSKSKGSHTTSPYWETFYFSVTAAYGQFNRANFSLIKLITSQKLQSGMTLNNIIIRFALP